MKKSAADIKILIVDDEEALRKAIAFDFKRKGFQVFEAGSGNKAMLLIEAEPIDIVISDVRMPDGDGISLLQRIKERDANLPIVLFITGYADLTVEDAYEYGVDAIFSKPFERKALMQMVTDKLTEREELWSREPTSQAEASIEKSMDPQKLNWGRGGFFLPSEDPIPADNTPVHFLIQNKASEKIYSGEGIVRWGRREGSQELEAGCGIEISYLEPQSLKKALIEIASKKNRSYIPKK